MNQICYVGYDATHTENFRFDIPTGFPCYLLVITTTTALFRVDGKELEYPAHTAVLYPPNHPVWYRAAGKPYGNHWLYLASDESYITGFPQTSVPFSVSDPEYFYNLFQLLTWETSQLTSSCRLQNNAGDIMLTQHPDLQKSGSLDASPIVSQLLRVLFYKLCNELLYTQHTVHDHALLALRRKISANPQYPWSVTDMAREMHISTGHLQLIYKQRFHISCMDDVIHFRLNKAKDLLTYTTLSIAETALQCGYNNTEHFCRQFRLSTGLTPGQYRKKAAASQ